MIDNVENGIHIEACMTMMSGLLPLLGSGSVSNERSGRKDEDQPNNDNNNNNNNNSPSSTPSRTSPNENRNETRNKTYDLENVKKLYKLKNTVLQLLVDAASSARATRLLDFLRDVCIHADIKLSSSEIKSMWQPMTKRSSEHSTSLFKWLVAYGNRLVDKEGMEEIYTDLVLTRMENNPGKGKDCIFLFRFFLRMFDSINQKKNLLIDGKAMTLELEGMNSLWLFLSNDTSQISLNMAVQKIITIVLNLHNKSYQGDKKIGWNIFIEKCMALMTDNSTCSKIEKNKFSNYVTTLVYNNYTYR